MTPASFNQKPLPTIPCQWRRHLDRLAWASSLLSSPLLTRVSLAILACFRSRPASDRGESIALLNISRGASSRRQTAQPYKLSCLDLFLDLWCTTTSSSARKLFNSADFFKFRQFSTPYLCIVRVWLYRWLPSPKAPWIDSYLCSAKSSWFPDSRVSLSITITLLKTNYYFKEMHVC